VFGDRDSGAYLPRLSWTPIVRHTMVKGGASPDDPSLAGYWATRRRKVTPPLDTYTLRLLTRQDARCPFCGDYLLTAEQPPQSPEQWERWWLQVTRRAIAANYLLHHGDQAHRTVTKPASSTPPATAGTSPAKTGAQHSQPEPPSRLA
jgi:RNA-directed DNA polymerase